MSITQVPVPTLYTELALEQKARLRPALEHASTPTPPAFRDIPPEGMATAQWLLEDNHALSDENSQLREQFEDLKQRFADLERRHTEQHQRYQEHLDWTRHLFANTTIPAACKMVLYHFYTVFFFMRPDIIGEEMQIGVEDTAKAVGMSTSTVRKATDKAEMWDVLTRKYENYETADGEKRTKVHITLAETVAHPEHIQMEKLHGGPRVKRCSKCGSEDVDRYTVQYCRHCDENDWYRQPGTRSDADTERAQNAKNTPLYTESKKQDAFDTSEHDPEPITLSNQIDAAIEILDTQQQNTLARAQKQDASAALQVITVTEIPTRDDVGQDEFITPAPEQLAAEHSLYPYHGKLQMEQHVATCHARFLLNTEGKPAHAMVNGHPEKIESSRECGSTQWQWSEVDQCRVCAKCWTPQP
jgi:hypothetical protein